jgi:predicted transcriptional regulator
MLEHIFGSKTRVKLLSLFLKNPDKSFFVRELTRKLKLQINSIRRELANLRKIGIIKLDKTIADKLDGGKVKKYYKANKDFVLYSELKVLFIKSQLLIRQGLLNKLTQLGKIDFLALAGVFVGEKMSLKTDILIIGKVNREKLKKLIKKFESEFGHEINYTIMSPDEFKYRKDVTDKFLYDILDGKHIIAVDNMK